MAVTKQSFTAREFVNSDGVSITVTHDAQIAGLESQGFTEKLVPEVPKKKKRRSSSKPKSNDKKKTSLVQKAKAVIKRNK